MRGENTDLGKLKDVIEDIGRTFEEYKSENDARLEALGAGDESKAAEIHSKLSKMDGHITNLLKLKSNIEVDRKNMLDRIEELEARRTLPGSTVIDKLNEDYKSIFMGWIRNRGNDPQSEQKMLDLMRKAEQLSVSERKSITIGTGSAGGFAVPEEIAREIERLERKFSPVRDLVKVVRSGTSDYKELVNIRGTTAGWVGESTTRTETSTPSLRERTPTHGELYAYPQVSEWSLDDIFFNVEQWLTEEVAEIFSIEEGDAVINGNGTNKPTGMLNTSPVTTDDAFPPTRSAEAYEAVLHAASPQSDLQPDALLDMVYTLNSRYRVMAAWVMNSATTGAVRKLKDNDGTYLWQPGLQLGQPDRLLGYPTATWEQMEDIANGNFPIGFGHWRRAYVLVDRVGLRITRDNITTPGFVKFYIRRREGGIVLNNDAAKFLQIA